MTTEFNVPLKNGTWTLVLYDSKQHTVGYKWVFKLKRKANGFIERYKARLVAKGFIKNLILISIKLSAQ